jgi:hypothetical protein
MIFARVTLIVLAGMLVAAPAVLARSHDEIQAPRAQEIQAPRAHEVQAPRGDEIQAPRSDDARDVTTLQR